MDRDVFALELFIAKFLRVGVAVAGLLMLTGWLSQLSFSSDVFARFQEYHELRLVPQISLLWQAREWGRLVSYLGMFVLICLPVVRVLLTLLVFLKKRDFLLAMVSALVLFGLVLSAVLGFEI
jgi:uncharacterized membrane protein